MADEIQDLATDLAALITAAEAVPATFPQEFQTAMRWLILEEVADLNGTFQISVVPLREERERQSRTKTSAAFYSTYVLQVVAQVHVDDDLAAVDDLAALGKAVHKWIEDNQQEITLAGGSRCTLIDSERPILIARRLLKSTRIASTAAELRYGVT